MNSGFVKIRVLILLIVVSFLNLFYSSRTVQSQVPPPQQTKPAAAQSAAPKPAAKPKENQKPGASLQSPSRAASPGAAGDAGKSGAPKGASAPTFSSPSGSANPNILLGDQSKLLGDQPQSIEVSLPLEPLEKRLERKITLDIRDMNIIDVIKFLAMKGEFNVVTSAAIEGRATLLLKSVSIKDALDIAVISNHLAYHIQSDIIQVMTSAEYEVMYGKQFSDKTEVSITHLHYAKPSYILAALDNIKSSVGKIIIDEDTGSVVLIDTPQTIEKMQDAIKSMEEPLNTYVVNLQYAKSDVVAEKLKARIDANSVGSIASDDRANQLIVRAFPGRLQEIQSVIKSLDTPTKEVLVEARILQIVFQPNFDYGIDWNLDFKDSSDPILKRLSFNNVYLGQSNNTLAASDNLFTSYAKVAVGAFDVNHFATAIRALYKVSDTKILSNPKLLVTNNQEAKIHIGDTVPYIISTTSGTGDNAITSEDVRFTEVGVKLSVTPTINDDGIVTMRLKPEISTVVSKIQSKGGGIPQVNKTEVETTVMVRDGMSIVMGGLKKEEDRKSTRLNSSH